MALKFLNKKKNKLSKVIHIQFGELKVQEYLLPKKTSLKLAKVIYQARNIMLDVKANYGNNLLCPIMKIQTFLTHSNICWNVMGWLTIHWYTESQSMRIYFQRKSRRSSTLEQYSMKSTLKENNFWTNKKKMHTTNVVHVNHLCVLQYDMIFVLIGILIIIM